MLDIGPKTHHPRRNRRHVPRTGRRLVIVVRADPVICGHSGEARNLAEAALERGFSEVRIVTWPIERLEESGLPLKPLDRVMPYSPGITVERPAAVGDYKIPDGRFTAGLVGRLVELFTDGVPTVCMSLYLMPHARVVVEALSAARATGLSVDVTTVAEAVGSDITNVVRSAVAEGRYGAAAHLFATYLAHDHCLAVSEYTRTLIVESAERVDAACGTAFADQCRRRVQVSYPAIDAASFTDLDEARLSDTLNRRGLERDRYVLFLSRLSPAKGVDDLIDAYAASSVRGTARLVIAGNGPIAAELHARAESAAGERIVFLHDVGDDEKPYLMRGSLAYVLPSKPRPEFVETFGIALVENMLAGGGPVITTTTGGIPEAVGDTAITVDAGSPEALAAALDRVASMESAERAAHTAAALRYALRFDRMNVFDGIMTAVG